MPWNIDQFPWVCQQDWHLGCTRRVHWCAMLLRLGGLSLLRRLSPAVVCTSRVMTSVQRLGRPAINGSNWAQSSIDGYKPSDLLTSIHGSRDYSNASATTSNMTLPVVLHKDCCHLLHGRMTQHDVCARRTAHPNQLGMCQCSRQSIMILGHDTLCSNCAEQLCR